MTAIERADAIIQDILVNHLPRIKEGLERGYVDENQILAVYDHAVRARILREHAGVQPEKSTALGLANVFNARQDALRASQVKSYNEHEDALDRIDTELSATQENTAICPGCFKRVTECTCAPPPMNVKEVKGKFAGKPKTVRGQTEHAMVLDEANFHKAHADKLECVCGGLIHDDPQFTGDVFLECGSCGRTFISEFELAQARKTEVKAGTKCVDATYFTTGTLAGGTDPVPMETEINLNGRKTTIKAKNGKFTLTYEEIVRMAVNQRRDALNAFTGSDANLPHETVTYGHRVPFKDLPGERDGSLWKGKSVECTPGMCITCIGTGNA